MTLKWTQKQAAIHFGVNKDSYQQWEWNNYIPHVKYRKKVNEFLEYNFWDDGSGSIANRVLLYRIEHRMTMGDLAERLSICCHTIERVEGDKTCLSECMKNKIESFILSPNLSS